jgi:AraC family transcriptional regulator
MLDRANVTCEKAQAVGQFMRGKSRVLFSSSGLGWAGLLMEQHVFPAGEWPAAELGGLVLCLWNNASTVRCDHPDANGSFVPKLVHPGTLSLYTAGTLPAVRPCEPTFGLICAFDDDFLHELPEEIQSESNTRSVADGVISQDKRCFIDGPVQRILESLSDEARRGDPSGPLYANDLIHSLRARLLYLTRARAKGHWLKNKMDVGTLRRLSDRLETTPETDLDLDTLAAESGCSKRHLMRSYRASTGRSPHQYILDLRMEKARRLMLSPSLNLIDIAMECGFASQAHFTHAFRQRLGVPPSAFRGRLSKTE